MSHRRKKPLWRRVRHKLKTFWSKYWTIILTILVGILTGLFFMPSLIRIISETEWQNVCLNGFNHSSFYAFTHLQIESI